jgi:hypothetical protein
MKSWSTISVGDSIFDKDGDEAKVLEVGASGKTFVKSWLKIHSKNWDTLVVGTFHIEQAIRLGWTLEETKESAGLKSLCCNAKTYEKTIFTKDGAMILLMCSKCDKNCDNEYTINESKFQEFQEWVWATGCRSNIETIAKVRELFGDNK